MLWNHKAGLKFRHCELCDISVTNILKPFWTTENVSKQLKMSQPRSFFYTDPFTASDILTLFSLTFWIPEGLWGCVRIFSPLIFQGILLLILKPLFSFKKKIFKARMQREIAELTFIKKFNSISQTGFNRDLSFLSQYRCISCPFMYADYYSYASITSYCICLSAFILNQVSHFYHLIAVEESHILLHSFDLILFWTSLFLYLKKWALTRKSLHWNNFWESLR